VESGIFIIPVPYPIQKPATTQSSPTSKSVIEAIRAMQMRRNHFNIANSQRWGVMLSTTTPEIRYITRFVHEQPMKVAHYWVRLTRNGRRQLLDIVTDGAFVEVAIAGGIGLVDAGRLEPSRSL